MTIPPEKGTVKAALLKYVHGAEKKSAELSPTVDRSTSYKHYEHETPARLIAYFLTSAAADRLRLASYKDRRFRRRAAIL